MQRTTDQQGNICCTVRYFVTITKKLQSGCAAAYHLIQLSLAALSHGVDRALLPLHCSALVEIDSVAGTAATGAAGFIAHLQESQEPDHLLNNTKEQRLPSRIHFSQCPVSSHAFPRSDARAFL
jgi:hypothetical protein